MDRKRFPWLYFCLLPAIGYWVYLTQQPVNENKGLPANHILPLIFCILTFLFCGFSLFFYRFQYSLLGSKKRVTPLGARYLDWSLSSTHCKLSNSYALVQTYDQGLLLRVFMAGSGFLRFDEIESVQEGLLSSTIHHRSPAFRTPLKVGLSAEAQQKVQSAGVPVLPMSKGGALVLRAFFVVFTLALLVLFMAFVGASTRTRHGGFSSKRDHSIIVNERFGFEVLDLDLATGEVTSLEESWGWPSQLPQVAVLSYADPGYLKWVSATSAGELFFEGRNLGETWDSGQLSPDGSFLCYDSSDGPLVLRKTKGDERPILKLDSGRVSGWSSSSKNILLSLSNDNSNDFEWRIYDVKGTKLGSQKGLFATWGPGAEELSLLRTIGDSKVLEVYKGFRKKPLVSIKVSGWTSFRWQPGGKKVLYQTDEGLFLDASDLKSPQKINSEREGNFEWSASGKFFYAEDQDGFGYFKEDGTFVRGFGR